MFWCIYHLKSVLCILDIPPCRFPASVSSDVGDHCVWLDSSTCQFSSRLHSLLRSNSLSFISCVNDAYCIFPNFHKISKFPLFSFVFSCLGLIYVFCFPPIFTMMHASCFTCTGCPDNDYYNCRKAFLETQFKNYARNKLHLLVLLNFSEARRFFLRGGWRQPCFSSSWSKWRCSSSVFQQSRSI